MRINMNHKSFKATVAIIFALLLFLGVSGSEKGKAADNTLLNFTGKITDISGNNIPDGAYDISFKVYYSSCRRISCLARKPSL